MKSLIEPVSPRALEAARNGVEMLTPREIEVLRNVVRGATSAQMAELLNISPRTAELHRANIFRKIGAKSAVQAVRLLALIERSPVVLLIGLGLTLLNGGAHIHE